MVRDGPTKGQGHPTPPPAAPPKPFLWKIVVYWFYSWTPQIFGLIQIQHNKKSTNHQYHNSIIHNQKNLIEKKNSLGGDNNLYDFLIDL